MAVLRLIDELVLCRLLDREIAGLRAFEDLVDEDRRGSPDVDEVWPVASEPASLDVESEVIHGREPVQSNQVHDVPWERIEGTGGHEECPGSGGRR